MATTNNYFVGNLIQLSVAFLNTALAPTDPSTVTLRVLPPDGTVQVFTYALSQVIRYSAGNYYYNFPVTLPGPHYYRFEGGGTLVAASDSSFIAAQSPTLGD